MSYDTKNNTFNLTAKKMSYWHRHAHHQLASEEVQKNCPFCNGDFETIKELLLAKGIKVLTQGHAWVKIKAEKNIRIENYGPTSDEVDLLFKLVTERESND